MTWLVAGAYVLASVLLVAAAGTRLDHRVRRSLGARDVSRLVSLARRVRPRIKPPRALSERLRAQSERALIAATVPDLLDLLAVSVTAGLSPRLALERTPDVLSGVLGETLAAARREVALGVPWRQALEAAGTRTGVADLRRLALTLQRAERLGSPIALRLRELAADVRAERRARRVERAGRAPVQMLFPLVFLILPAFVLTAVVPALLVATRDMV